MKKFDKWCGAVGLDVIRLVLLSGLRKNLLLWTEELDRLWQRINACTWKVILQDYTSQEKRRKKPEWNRGICGGGGGLGGGDTTCLLLTELILKAAINEKMLDEKDENEKQENLRRKEK